VPTRLKPNPGAPGHNTRSNTTPPNTLLPPLCSDHEFCNFAEAFSNQAEQAGGENPRKNTVPPNRWEKKKKVG